MKPYPVSFFINVCEESQIQFFCPGTVQFSYDSLQNNSFRTNGRVSGLRLWRRMSDQILFPPSLCDLFSQEFRSGVFQRTVCFSQAFPNSPYIIYTYGRVGVQSMCRLNPRRLHQQPSPSFFCSTLVVRNVERSLVCGGNKYQRVNLQHYHRNTDNLSAFHCIIFFFQILSAYQRLS